MNNFKIGDLVMVNKDAPINDYFKAFSSTIIKINSDSQYDAVILSDSLHVYVYFNEIHKIMAMPEYFSEVLNSGAL